MTFFVNPWWASKVISSLRKALERGWRQASLFRKWVPIIEPQCNNDERTIRELQNENRRHFSTWSRLHNSQERNLTTICFCQSSQTFRVIQDFLRKLWISQTTRVEPGAQVHAISCFLHKSVRGNYFSIRQFVARNDKRSDKNLEVICSVSLNLERVVFYWMRRFVFSRIFTGAKSYCDVLSRKVLELSKLFKTSCESLEKAKQHEPSQSSYKRIRGSDFSACKFFALKDNRSKALSSDEVRSQT